MQVWVFTGFYRFTYKPEVRQLLMVTLNTLTTVCTSTFVVHVPYSRKINTYYYASKCNLW